jgi:hypothetical protein
MIESEKKIYLKFFFGFLGKSIPPKKLGFAAALVSLAGRKVQKPSVEFFTFFSLSGFRSFLVVFVCEFEPSAAIGFRRRVCSALF